MFGRHRNLVAALALITIGCGHGSTPMSTDGGVDALVLDLDNGAPSTVYPAPHPPLPQVVNNANGRVLTTPNVYLIFYPSNAMEADLKAFAQTMTMTTYWSTTTAEYGVGALSFKGAIDLTDTPPTAITQDDLRTWVGMKIQTGAFGTPDPQAIYTILFPSSTSITQNNPLSPALGRPASCVNFGGYHDSVSVALNGGMTDFAFAVIPSCGGGLSNLTDVISHEWIEAATDPDLSFSQGLMGGGPKAAFFFPDADHLVWAILGGGEVGDLCEPEGSAIDITPADIGSLVQRTWSNAAAKAGHDPCVPAISGAYFAAAPVLNDTLMLSNDLTGAITTKGIKIPVGGTKTIEVDLFSDGDTNGPWTVSADDAVSAHFGSFGLKPSMTFEWDRTSGQNGEKLHLSITITANSLIAGAHVFEIVSKKGSRVAVWPGLVIEE